MRTLCLCNPASGGKPGRLAELEQFAVQIINSANPGGGSVEVAATHNAADALATLARFRPTADDLVVLSGGDGTIQHAATLLLHGTDAATGVRGTGLPTADELPLMALLPAGSTNMTALDINKTRGWEASLRRLADHIAGRERLSIAPRRLLTVTDGTYKRSGFFVGAGAIVHGIEYCNNVLWAKGAARKERTAGLAMARTIWGVLRQQPPFDQPDELSVLFKDLGAEAEVIDLAGAEHRLAPASGALLFASATLDRLIVGARPFWGDTPADCEGEPLRFVLVERDARLIRNLPGLLGVPGFARPVAASGFHSHNCARLRLQLGQSYAIDGELFQPEPGDASSGTAANTGELGLDVAAALRFLVL